MGFEYHVDRKLKNWELYMSIWLPSTRDEWTVYGTETCQWCRRTKELLTEHGILYVYHDLNQLDMTKAEAIQYLRDHDLIPPDYLTIPLIYRRGCFMGGYQELQRKLDLLARSSCLNGYSEDF